MNAKHASPSATTAPPDFPGSPVENACTVSGAPFSPDFHAPVVTITSPVKLTITSVSMNVCVIDTSACRAGSFVRAAAAAMPPVPSPDSFEKIPRATPIWIAFANVAPANPPTTDSAPPNASVRISQSASGSPR